MPFTVLVLNHAPDADPQRDHTVITTGLYTCHTVVVPDQERGAEVCRRMAADEGIQAVMLCPGHTNADVAEIAGIFGPEVSVNVARGDGPSNGVAMKAMQEAGWFAARAG